jgi:hypothetical protein
MDLSNTSQQKIPKKVFFTSEQDKFLQHLLKDNQNSQNRSFWKYITKFFNERYPDSQKKTKDIKLHYNNCLRKDLRGCKFSSKEKIQFLMLKKIQHLNCSEIATIMSRTIGSVKNYYYREFQLCEKEVIPFKIPDSQMQNDITSFKNDLSFYGIQESESEQ